MLPLTRLFPQVPRTPDDHCLGFHPFHRDLSRLRSFVFFVPYRSQLSTAGTSQISNCQQWASFPIPRASRGNISGERWAQIRNGALHGSRPSTATPTAARPSQREPQSQPRSNNLNNSQHGQPRPQRNPIRTAELPSLPRPQAAARTRRNLLLALRGDGCIPIRRTRRPQGLGRRRCYWRRKPRQPTPRPQPAVFASVLVVCGRQDAAGQLGSAQRLRRGSRYL